MTSSPRTLLPLIVIFFAGNLAVYVPSNGNFTEIHYEYVLLDESNPCARSCVNAAPPMICRYNFTVEWYFTLSKACYDCPYNTTDCFRPDCIAGVGEHGAVVTVNRKLPGPIVEVCKGDLVVVDVHNRLLSESTTVHWHGQHVKDVPYMDGVPFVTQCPIPTGTTFRYTLRASQGGTHFWHSHIGMQRADGMFGAFVVRVPEDEDPHAASYDYDLAEHVVVVLDWDKDTGTEKIAAHQHRGTNNKPATILVNGMGRLRAFENGNGEVFYTPTARFVVEQGYRYRFRVVNAGYLNCPIEMSVDNHTMIVISSDGADIRPVAANSLVSYAGERFDIILHADQPKDLYWMRFRGLMDCDERFKKAHQVAVLQYGGLNATIDDYPEENVPEYDDPLAPGTQVNPLNKGTEENATRFVTVPTLQSLQKWDKSLKTHPDHQFYIAYDFYELNNYHFNKFPEYGYFNVSETSQRMHTPQFNHISMKTPSFPLLPQRNQIPRGGGMFCNAATTKGMNCEQELCECTHALEVPLDAVVEMVLVDEGVIFDANHPIHLHGHSFRVVAMERLGTNVTVEQVKARDAQGLIQRNLLDAPVKDTVTVPDGGYTIIRFQANNPGYWLFHCHIEFHAEMGMALVLKVGQHEEMPAVPVNFPKCGNYVPEPLVEEVPNDKKDCSRQKFVYEVEKYLFGDDHCQQVSAATRRNVFVGFLLAFFMFSMSS